jgi:predicted nuclease with RNAse H fold
MVRHKKIIQKYDKEDRRKLIMQYIIGIDCAVDSKNIGLALGEWRENRLCVLEVLSGGQVSSVAQQIAGWISHEPPTLMAFDAPLGWPQPLGRALADHQAGQVLEEDANQLFRRFTDRHVKEKVGKQPLDVGADRIARTTHAALKLLGEIRSKTGCNIPLAWSHELQETSVIEVYPAATLTQYHMPASGYKTKSDQSVRRDIIRQLQNHLALPDNTDLIEADADCLDAVVCLLAARDFIAGQAVAPEPELMHVAENEGWIWFRQ